MAKIRMTLYITKQSDDWLKREAKKLGVSRNVLIQMLINKEIEKKEGD